MMEQVLNYLSNKYLPFFQNLFDALLVFIIGWYITKLIVHFVIKVMKKSNVDSIVISFIKSILLIGLRLIVVITAISKLGFDVASLVAVLATAGAAIVLGLQDSMKGFVSGIVILFAKPFTKGDLIEVNGYIGRIQEIQLLYTILLTFDNKMVVIPNTELASTTFVNYSHEDQRRVDFTMDVHYQSDIEHVKKVIYQVIENNEKAFKEPLPYVRVSEYKDSSIQITIRVWTKTEYYYELKDDLLEQIKQAFDNENIEVPYPQLDLHVHKDKDII